MLTNESKELTAFFTQYGRRAHAHAHVSRKRETQIMNPLLKTIYHQLQSLPIHPMVDCRAERIQGHSDLPRPKRSRLQDLPADIAAEIQDRCAWHVAHDFSLHERRIHVHIVDTKREPDRVYHAALDWIQLWFAFILPYANPRCSRDLTLFLYWTRHTKRLPATGRHPPPILDTVHVNTAFTFTCQETNEIVIYRKQEWFKVLLHESFHNLGLDFSERQDSAQIRRLIRTLFSVPSEDVNLSEAYAECWARILNAAFVTYFSLRGSSYPSPALYVSRCQTALALEQSFSVFQMTKVLRFMGLRYADLVSGNPDVPVLYREKTNVLAYYVIAGIFMSDLSGFVSWCHAHNPQTIPFKPTAKNIADLGRLIQHEYKNPVLLERIRCAENSIGLVKQGFLGNTLRMSVGEWCIAGRL